MRDGPWVLVIYVTPGWCVPLNSTRPAGNAPQPTLHYEYFRPPWRAMPATGARP